MLWSRLFSACTIIIVLLTPSVPVREPGPVRCHRWHMLALCTVYNVMKWVQKRVRSSGRALLTLFSYSVLPVFPVCLQSVVIFSRLDASLQATINGTMSPALPGFIRLLAWHSPLCQSMLHVQEEFWVFWRLNRFLMFAITDITNPSTFMSHAVSSEKLPVCKEHEQKDVDCKVGGSFFWF